MRAFATVIACLAASAFVAADDPTPSRWLGTWTGTHSQKFAWANPGVPGSNECMSSPVTRSITFNITATSITVSALPATNITIGSATYAAPAVSELHFRWATLANNSIVQWYADDQSGAPLRCFFGELSGNGDNRKITWINLGGTPATSNWAVQCDQTNYKFPNYLTQPICNPVGNGSFSPYESTELVTLNYVAGSGVPESGAASIAMTAAAGLTALLAALLAL